MDKKTNTEGKSGRTKKEAEMEERTMKQLNKKGVIGIIVITALLVLTYTLAQALVVPFWDKEVEAKHIDVVYSDMTSLSSNIEAAAQRGTSVSSIVRLGVQYPNRILFFNPDPGAVGSITVEDVGITGSYTASGVSTHPINYNSSRIVYDLNGMIHSPKLVYEHGIIIWDWGDGRIVTVNSQSLINEDTGNVHIPVVNASQGTTSGLATKKFDISPYSTASDRIGVESVTITLDTDYPEVWSKLLKDYINAGMVSVSNQTKKIYISSSGFPYISLPDQPSPGALSSGILSFNHELPPVASQDAITVVENNATSTLTVTPTSDDGGPLVISGGGSSSSSISSRSSSSSSGGGGGGGSSSGSSSGGIDDELPTVSTENATNVSVTTATLNMGFDFNDYDTVHLQFKYKAKGASAWDETDLVLQSGLGAHRYTEQIANLSANTTYCFMAILRYDSTELNGTELSFTTCRELIPPTVETENATSVSASTATLNMGFEFNDYAPVNVQFRYKDKGASAWYDTGWNAQNGSGADTYAEPIVDLSLNTTYCFMAMLLYDSMAVNGYEFTFTTCRELIPPTVVTGNATTVTTATATLNMDFEFNDYTPVNVQFRYKDKGASAWYDTGWEAREGSGAATYAEQITNLSHNTTYYFMALLLYDGMAVNGTVHTFTTCRELIPPTVCTGNATNVSVATTTRNMGFEFNDYAPVKVQHRYNVEGATKATSYSMATTEKATCLSAANVTLDMDYEFHDYSSVQVQFRYKAEGATGWTDTGWVTREGSGADTYAEQITNLSYNTTYYFMALLLYDGMAVNGTVHTFTTCRERIPATVCTGNATNVSMTTATLNMVFAFKDYAPVNVQFRYKAEGAIGWTDTGWVTREGSGAATYAEQITKLSANTTYYFMALLLYDGTELNGTVHTFTTCRDPIPPAVETENATYVSARSAVLNMAYNFYDYSPVQVQFRYKAEGASAWTETGWVARNGSGVHTFAEPISNLTYVTTYYFQAMLQYESTVIEGAEKSFMTFERPIVRTKTATNITDTTAVLNMAFDFKDYRSVRVQFKYKAEGASAWDKSGWVSQSGSGFHWYREPIADLSEDKTYFFRAQLLYAGTVLEGVERSFRTLESPAVSTKTATDVSDVSAILNMVFDPKDYSPARIQFRYKAEGASTWNETDPVSQSGSQTYSESITGLSSNTTYYFMAILLYDSTEIEGVENSFTTLESPTVRTGDAAKITDVSARLDMAFDFNDYDTVQVQFKYKAENASVWNDTGWVSQSGTNLYSEPITGLSTNTTYYFMAQLLYDSTEIEGVEKTFTTLEPPTVRTGNATNITDVSARLNMTCDLNDYDTVRVQFKYKAEGVKVWAATGWVYLNESQTYSESITNLSTITTYYYKAQLLYDSTEIEGVEKSFMTLEPPAVHTKTATNITDATATLNMAFDFNEYTSVQVQFTYKANDASEWNDTGWVAQNGSGFHWVSEPIAGLSSSRVYQFKAQLRYDGTVIEGPTRSFITMEKLKVSTKNAIVQKLPRGWAVTLKMDYDFKDYDHGYVRFAYKKVGVADWDHTDWISASHSGTYDELIMGLKDHTTYYFYAQLKYGDEKNIKGDTLTFKTLGPR